MLPLQATKSIASGEQVQTRRRRQYSLIRMPQASPHNDRDKIRYINQHFSNDRCLQVTCGTLITSNLKRCKSIVDPMPIDGVSSATFVFPLFNFALRAFQTGCEFSSVQSETKDLLEVISEVASAISSAKVLKRRNPYFFDDNEIAKVDKLIKSTENAMAGLEELVEPARVDMALNYGQVKAGSRIMWIMRDSKKVGAALGRLHIANQMLQTQIIIMNGKAGKGNDDDEDQHKIHRRNDSDQGAPPPSYSQAVCDAMNERRQYPRRPKPASTPPNVPPDDPTEPPVPTANTDTGLLASMNNVADFIRYNEEVLAALSSASNSSSREAFIPAVLTSSPNDASSLDHIYEMDGSPPAATSQRPLPESVGVQPTSGDLRSPLNVPNPNEPPPLVPVRRSRPRYPSMAHTYGSFPNQTHAQIPATLLPGSRQYPLSALGVTAPGTAVNSSATAPSSAPTRETTPQPQAVVTSSPSADVQNVPTSLVLPQRHNPRSTSTSAIMESETVIPGHRRPIRLRWHEPVEDRNLSSDASRATNLERPSVALPSGQVPTSTIPATGQPQRNSHAVRSLHRRSTSHIRIQGERSAGSSTARNRQSRIEWQIAQQMTEIGM